MYGARSICPAVARRVRVGQSLQSRRKHQHFHHHHHHSTARRTIYSNKAYVEIQRRCLTVCPPLFGSADDPANPTSTNTSTGTSRGGAGKGKENSKWMVQIPRWNKEGADTQPTTMTPEPPPGSRWEQMLLRAGEAGEGEAVEVVEYSTPGPPRAPRLGIGRGKRGLFRHTEVKVPAGLVSPKLTLIGMCDNDIDTRVAKLEEEAGLPSLDALRIALALSFVHKLDFPPTFAAVVKELQRVQADIATVVLDQPFLFTAHPDVIAERLASLEKAGLLAEDVGEIVTKQPSLLALPVDAELFSRPAARYDVEVGPESSAYAEVAKALKMRRQLRRWESPQETEAADVAEFLSTFAVRGTDVAKALPHLKSTPLEELEEKIVWLQRAPVSLGWADVSKLLITQSATFASFDLQQATANVALINDLLRAAGATSTVSAVLSKAPKLLTSSTLERDVEGLKELGLTTNVLGKLASSYAPALTSGAFAWKNMWPRMVALQHLYSKEDVSSELNAGDAQVLRVTKTTFILRLGVLLRTKDLSPTKALPPNVADFDAALLMNIKPVAFAKLVGVELDAIRIFAVELIAELRFRKSIKSKKPVHRNSSNEKTQFPRPEDAAIDTYLMLPPKVLRKIELQTKQ